MNEVAAFVVMYCRRTSIRIAGNPSLSTTPAAITSILRNHGIPPCISHLRFPRSTVCPRLRRPHWTSERSPLRKTSSQRYQPILHRRRLGLRRLLQLGRHPTLLRHLSNRHPPKPHSPLPHKRPLSIPPANLPRLQP